MNWLKSTSIYTLFNEGWDEFQEKLESSHPLWANSVKLFVLLVGIPLTATLVTGVLLFVLICWLLVVSYTGYYVIVIPFEALSPLFGFIGSGA